MSNKKTNMDRISNLPDSLLHHILSFLNTQQVVRTCVLSKRWKPVWTHIPTLDFDFDSYTFEGSENHDHLRVISFTHFVMRVLCKHCGSNITKLSYYASVMVLSSGVLEFLLFYVAFHKVQELDLFAGNESGVDWKRCLSACQSLKVFKIACEFVYEWGGLMLPSLTHLEIGNAWNQGLDDTEKMFSGCPNLKSLVLVDFIWDQNSSIYSPKLEHFKLLSTSIYAPACEEIELFTPNLRSATFDRVFPPIKSTSNFLCLVNVNIIADFDCNSRSISKDQSVRENLVQMLKVFHNARSITLPLSSAKDLLSPSANLSFPNLKHLNLRESKKSKKIALQLNEMMLKFPSLTTMEIDL